MPAAVFRETDVAVTIIIVNWNSREYVRACLDSIFETTKDLSCEVIVVDNASRDGCGEMIRREYPGVTFISSEINLGFARANNLAAREAKGTRLLFLNPDTEVQSSAIGGLVTGLDTLPEAGIVGPRILNSDLSIQTTCVRVFPTLVNQVLDTNYFRKVFPDSGLWGGLSANLEQGLPAAVDALSGACMMIDRMLFERVGMFSTEYFMYSEDIDLCFKVHEVGMKNYFVPGAVIVHHGGGSSSENGGGGFSSIMMLESRFRYFKKTRSEAYAIVYRGTMGLVSAFRVLALLVMLPVGSLVGKGRTVRRALSKWRSRLLWALRRERWLKDEERQ